MIHIHSDLLTNIGKGYIVSSTVLNLQPSIEPLLRRLLLQVGLNTALPRLAIVVLPLRLSLLRVVASETGNSTTNRAANTILHTLAQIAQLPLGFLALSFLVLTNTLLLQPLGANETPDTLLQRTDILVPRPSAAVRVILCDAARGGCSEGAGFGGCVGKVFFGGGLGLAVLALCLVESGDVFDRYRGEGGRETYLIGGAAGQ